VWEVTFERNSTGSPLWETWGERFHVKAGKGCSAPHDGLSRRIGEKEGKIKRVVVKKKGHLRPWILDTRETSLSGVLQKKEWWTGAAHGLDKYEGRLGTLGVSYSSNQSTFVKKRGGRREEENPAITLIRDCESRRGGGKKETSGGAGIVVTREGVTRRHRENP